MLRWEDELCKELRELDKLQEEYNKCLVRYKYCESKDSLELQSLSNRLTEQKLKIQGIRERAIVSN
jgi:two-component SAPR family response regulator